MSVAPPKSAVHDEGGVGAVLVQSNLQFLDVRAVVAPAQQRARGRRRQVARGRSAQRIVDQRARSCQGRHAAAVLFLALHLQELHDVAVPDQALQPHDPLGHGIHMVGKVDRSLLRRCTTIVPA